MQQSRAIRHESRSATRFLLATIDSEVEYQSLQHEFNQIPVSPKLLQRRRLNAMNDQTRYDNAPITEAIIDIRVEPCQELSLDALRSLCDKGVAQYPKIEPTFEARGMMQVRPGVSASASAHQKQTGFRCISDDQANICQMRLDGFTYSRLAPYESWEPFRDEAKRMWQDYRQVAAPREINRLAVRYINRIDIPHPSVELKDYFRTSPEVSPDLPQQLAGFFMQLRLPQDDISAELLINQTIVPPSQEETTSVILDLDLFRAESVPQAEVGIWDFFESLHLRKNAVFESCITDKTRELFVICQS